MCVALPLSRGRMGKPVGRDRRLRYLPIHEAFTGILNRWH
jgi:hypothetical protein